MAMQLAALDILITKGGFAPESARAIGEAVDLEIERSRESLATGQQLTETRAGLEKQLGVLDGKLTETRHHLEQKIEALRFDLELKIEALRSDLELKIEALRSDLELKIEALRSDLELKIETLRSELKADIANLAAKVEATKAEVLRWMFVAMTGQTVVLVGLMRLMK